jgi:outer membrane protein OmpA-like peptidoglycan-associated protein
VGGFPWWLVGLLAAIAVVVFAWGRRGHRHAVQQTRQVVMQPAAPSVPLNAGSVSALNQFLDGNAPVPQRFVLQDLRFSTDSAEIEPSTRQVLDDVAGVMTAHAGAKITIEGHTDNTGAADTNRQLSQARADASKRYLTEHGVNADRIETVGYGASRPIASNDTPEGRSENRRTEIVVTAR